MTPSRAGARHQPLRLSAVVHAPLDRVTEVLADRDHLAGLLDNGWLSLTVLDPQQDDAAFHYAGDLEWDARRETGSPPAVTPASADD